MELVARTTASPQVLFRAPINKAFIQEITGLRSEKLEHSETLKAPETTAAHQSVLPMLFFFSSMKALYSLPQPISQVQKLATLQV